MLQLRRDLDLLQKPVWSEHRREVGPEDLDGYLAVMADVSSEVDSRHPTTTDLPLDCIAGGEGGLQAVDLVGHMSGSEVKLRPIHYDLVRALARGDA